MGKMGDRWDLMGKWKKRALIVLFFCGLVAGGVERGAAAFKYYATTARVDMVENLILAINIERRIEWLEKQVVTCEDEEKKGEQSSQRKVNCKKWKKELDEKYKDLKILQT